MALNLLQSVCSRRSGASFLRLLGVSVEPLVPSTGTSASPRPLVGGQPVRWRTQVAKLKKKGQFPKDFFQGKPHQEWLQWDGFGPYKIRAHNFPNNITLRDVQRRRILAQHAEERNRIVCLIRNDILPQELRDLAREEIHKVPRDSAITRVNRRCAITGRARGVFHQFRVSRFVFRNEADYNKVSGVQRAIWIKSIHIDP